jgi:hypothetical protein
MYKYIYNPNSNKERAKYDGDQVPYVKTQILHIKVLSGGRCGRDCMVDGFTTTYMQSVPITSKLLSSNPVHGEVYLIQHYVIKFVSDLRQVCGFLQVLRFPPPVKLAGTI